jgi:hypothetical protein
VKCVIFVKALTFLFSHNLQGGEGMLHRRDEEMLRTVEAPHTERAGRSGSKIVILVSVVCEVERGAQ